MPLPLLTDDEQIHRRTQMNSQTERKIAGATLVPLPALSDNYIWLLSKNGKALVVDPGEARPVLDYLHRHDLALSAILLTHHHGDHTAGAAELQQATGAPVYGPAREKLPVCDHRLSEGDTITLPEFGLTLSVLDVPGHTAGHIALHGRIGGEQPVLFCGDTLFAAGCGRLFEGTPAQMVESMGKLRSLPPDTLVCCGHEYTLSNLRWALHVEPGNGALQQRRDQASRLRDNGLPTLPSTIGDELAINPYLRLSEPAVIAAASAHAGAALSSDVDVFACLREWKNNFR